MSATSSLQYTHYDVEKRKRSKVVHCTPGAETQACDRGVAMESIIFVEDKEA
jgi:hypothetical protein